MWGLNISCDEGTQTREEILIARRGQECERKSSENDKV